MDMVRSEDSEKQARNANEKEIAQDMRCIYPVVGLAGVAIPHGKSLLLPLVQVSQEQLFLAKKPRRHLRIYTCGRHAAARNAYTCPYLTGEVHASTQ
jgi:hypothetical protein